MQQLRSELETYASDGEPPMKLVFDEVMTTAKRKHQRRRSTMIASGVAVVAAVAVAVPTLIMAPNSPPVGAAARSPADCKAETDKVKRVACVARQQLVPLLEPLKLESPILTGPVKDRHVTGFNALVSDGSEAVGTTNLTVSQPATPSVCTVRCEVRQGPRGEQVHVMWHPSDDGKDRVAAVSFSTRGYQVDMQASRFPPDRTGGVGPRAIPLLGVDAMIQVVTTPELLP